MYYLLEEVVQHKGDAEAIWCPSGSLSWNQLFARVNQYAQWFLSQGVKPGDIVAFYMANSSDFMCAWYGLNAIGAAPAGLNTNLASKALLHCLELAQVKLVLVDGDTDLLSRLEGVQAHLEASGHKIVKLVDVRAHIFSLAPVRPPDELRKDVTTASPLFFAYTSGTTGLPKAVTFPALIGVMTALVVCLSYPPGFNALTEQINRGRRGMWASGATIKGSITVCRTIMAQAAYKPVMPWL